MEVLNTLDVALSEFMVVDLKCLLIKANTALVVHRNNQNN